MRIKQWSLYLAELRQQRTRRLGKSHLPGYSQRNRGSSQFREQRSYRAWKKTLALQRLNSHPTRSEKPNVPLQLSQCKGTYIPNTSSKVATVKRIERCRTYSANYGRASLTS